MTIIIELTKEGKIKMNKKLMGIMLVSVFAIGLVSAFAYYGLFSTTMDVQQSITFDCDDDLGLVYNGDVVIGSPCVISNDAPTERSISLSYDAAEGIGVEYVGTLDLSKKNTDTWASVGEPIQIGYTIIGDSFEVTDVPEGYTAIYYKDGIVGLEGRLENPQPAVSIVGVTILPEEDDFNIDELANYCDEPDNYNQCKGAKLWVVPNEDLSESTLTWANMANYYYELDLIQYNSEGNLVLSPESTMTLTPVYTIGAGVTGEQVITTTVA